jgi:hypothetical protein
MSHEQNQRLIAVLSNCVIKCNRCTSACLNEQDVKMLVRCIKLDIDCAEICQLTTSLIARGSDQIHHLLNECAKICIACAEECEKHKHMDHCEKCAEACRDCAETCKIAA